MASRISPTHFVCIPLAGAQLSRSLAAFRDDVTSPLSYAVPCDAVRPPGTLHLTLGVLSLRDEDGSGVGRAVALLQGLRLREMLATARAGIRGSAAAAAAASMPSEEERQGISISIKGLEAMQAAERTTVLYAPPEDPEGILHRFCEQIRAAFQQAGLMADEGRPLLLHATVVNTIYVRGASKKGSRRGGRGNQRGRLTLDARDMVSRYGGYTWVEDMPVDKVAICRMGASKVEGTDDEAYVVEAEVSV